MNKDTLLTLGVLATAVGFSVYNAVRGTKDRAARVANHKALEWDDQENFSSATTSDGIILVCFKKGNFWHVEASRGVASVKSTKLPSLEVAKKSSFAFAEHIRFPPASNPVQVPTKPFKVNL